MSEDTTKDILGQGTQGQGQDQGRAREAQDRAVLALAAGLPTSAIPAIGGPAASTLARLTEDPEFQARVASERARLQDRGAALFAELLLATDSAFKNIHDALDPTTLDYGPKARLETSRWVVETVLPAKRLGIDVATQAQVSPEVMEQLARALDLAEARRRDVVVIPLDEDEHLLDK